MSTRSKGVVEGAGHDSGITVDKILLGLLTLTVADREERIQDSSGTAPLHGPRRTEVVLAEAGFSTREIAEVTGKDYEAVKGIVRRAREAREKVDSAKKVAANGRI